jgi:hypothetical protein
MDINKLKTCIQSANINFLFGSGLSKPYLDTLGNIEKWLTELSRATIGDKVKKIIEASIYREYFIKVLWPNYNPNESNGSYKNVIDNYKDFLIVWNNIFNKRANKLLSKQINIYTTNIDTLVEKAVEQTQVEFNDGFKGSIKQVFDEGNFQKSYSKTSLYFQNTFEIPVFNLLKMHGSINWKEDTGKIINDYSLNQIKNIEATLIESKYFIECGNTKDNPEKNIEGFINDAEKIINDNKDNDFDTLYTTFIESYKKLIIVNPTKRKFSETVMDIHFYELMRMYSNSLEKENSILFVMGFSFADEHIREITLRAAKTNPTLLVVIFSFDGKDFSFSTSSSNNNIIVITPETFKKSNPIDKKERGKKEIIDKIKTFDLATINKVYSLIQNEIPSNYGE